MQSRRAPRVIKMCLTYGTSLFLSHDPPPIPPATPRATNSSAPPRSSLRSCSPPHHPTVQKYRHCFLSFSRSPQPAAPADRMRLVASRTGSDGKAALWHRSTKARGRETRHANSYHIIQNEHRDEGVSATSHRALASPPRRSLLLLDTRGPRKGVLHTGRLPLARPWPPSGRVLHTGRTRTANPLPPLGGGLAHGPANYACLPVAASSGLAYGSPCPPLGGLAHGPATERRRTTTEGCCVPTRAQSRTETPIDGARPNWVVAPATGPRCARGWPPSSSHASAAHTATRSSSQGPASALHFNY